MSAVSSGVDGRAGPTTTSNSLPSASNADGATGFDAFGTADAPVGSVGPAFWVSVRGTLWTRQTASPFGSGFPFPAVDVAPRGPVWLAASGGITPAVGWTERQSIIPAAPSGLWRTTDGGGTWQRLDTTGAPWQGDQPAQIDRVALLGGIAVVAGEQDGRLAVWVGTPT